MRAAADAFEGPREGNEVKKWEVVRGTGTTATFSLFFCQILKRTSSFWKKSVPGPVVRGRRGGGGGGGGEGMDVHVKEGQLYVQHQKFGKVSPTPPHPPPKKR